MHGLNRAVVLGGSIAGLLAARVLADHVEGEVVVIEPDDLTADGAQRRTGAPQSNQLHVLLEMGRLHFERWLPGLVDELVAHGAVIGTGESGQMYLDGRLKVYVPGNGPVGATRTLLESRIRHRVMALDNVRLLRGRARGLLFDHAGTAVRAVVCSPGDQGPDTATIDADLVVDATGRGSRLGAWLEESGWEAPPSVRMDIDLGYATARFARGAELGEVLSVLSTGSSPKPGRPPQDTIAMAAVENDQWMAVIANYAEQRPTADAESFVTRLKGSGIEPLRTVAEECALDGDVAAHRTPFSLRRSFHELRRFPAGLVVAGDAVASFNPVYGQGMTCAALHASCLSAYLRRGPSLSEPAWDYFRRIAMIADVAWQLSSLGDLAYPHVTGPRPPGYRAMQWFGRLLGDASVTDQGINQRFLQVVNMRRHPVALREPWFVAAVLRHAAAQALAIR